MIPDLLTERSSVEEHASSGAGNDSALLLAMTTEHYTLQTARSATIVESNGRVSLFLGAVSSSLIAIALVAQVSRFGERFFVLALTLLPALIFLGGATYVRAIQNAIEDFEYARAINHIRNWYLGLHPDAPGLFLLSTDETPIGAMQGMTNPRWQALFTTAGVVAFVMSMLVGVTVALAVDSALSLDLYASAALGFVAGALCETALFTHHRSKWREATAS